MLSHLLTVFVLLYDKIYPGATWVNHQQVMFVSIAKRGTSEELEYRL